MKKSIIAILLTLGLIWSLPALAKVHISPLGYRVDLSESWLVLERDSLKKKPEVIDAAFNTARENQGLEAIPDQIVNDVKMLLNRGKIDYYFSPDPRFTVTVIKNTGNITKKSNEYGDLCKTYEKELTKAGGQHMILDECSLTGVDGHTAMYLVAGDYWKGRKMIQYLVQADPDTVLLFTASSPNKNFDEMKQEFRSIMTGVKIE